MDTFFYVLGGVYLLYVLILILRAYSDLRAMPYLGEWTAATLSFEIVSKCQIDQLWFHCCLFCIEFAAS